MRILLVNWWFPPFDSGGVPVYNLNMVKGLRARGHEVRVITSRRGNCGPEVAEGVVRVNYPRYARAQRVPAAGRYARFAACCVYASRAHRAASRLERSEGPFDVVEFAETNFEGLFWALKKKRYFIRSHTPWFLLDRFFSGEGRRSYSTGPIRRADEFFFRRATACSCPSGSLRQELMAEYGSGVPVEVIPNPVDTGAFRPAAAAPPKPVLLYFGRLERAKGIDIFLDAADILLREHQGLNIVVGGHSRDPAFTPESIRKRFSGDSRLTVRSDITDAEVPGVFRGASVFANPARVFESFSYTNAQAMASAVPVVTSASGGMPEIVRDGQDGTVVPGEDAAGWAAALHAYVADSGLRNEHGQSGRRRAEQEFSIPAVAALLERFYMQHLTP